MKQMHGRFQVCSVFHKMVINLNFLLTKENTQLPFWAAERRDLS